MISKERLSEIVEFSITNSDELALSTYNIKSEVLSRYKRLYKEQFGDSA